MSRPVRSGTDHAAMAARLRTQPGKPQQVSVHRSSTNAKDVARRIRTAYRRPAYEPPGAYDAEVVVYGDDYAVLARYIGGGGRRG